MSERRCRYCEKTFQPSKYQPQQSVCSQPECQKKRRSDSRQQRLASDEVYRQVCLDSSRKWRAEHPDYWRRYREKNPAAVAHNREQQQRRDRKQRLLHLLRNNTTSYTDVRADRIQALAATMVYPSALACARSFASARARKCFSLPIRMLGS